MASWADVLNNAARTVTKKAGAAKQQKTKQDKLNNDPGEGASAEGADLSKSREARVNADMAAADIGKGRYDNFVAATKATPLNGISDEMWDTAGLSAERNSLINPDWGTAARDLGWVGEGGTKKLSDISQEDWLSAGALGEGNYAQARSQNIAPLANAVGSKIKDVVDRTDWKPTYPDMYEDAIADMGGRSADIYPTWLGSDFLENAMDKGSRQRDYGEAFDANKWLNGAFYDDDMFNQWNASRGYGFASPTDLRADGTADQYLDYLDYINRGAGMFGGMAFENAYNDYLGDNGTGLLNGMTGATRGMDALLNVAKDWEDGNGIKYVNPWWTRNEQTYDIRNVANDRDTYEVLMGNNGFTNEDFADWLVADRYGANGELYNWASAVLPDYLKSIGAYNPDSDSLDMFSNLTDADREKQRQEVRDAIVMQRMNQLLENPGTQSMGMNAEDLFNFINEHSGGGYRTVPSDHTAITPSKKNVDNWGFDDMYENADDYYLTVRDLQNIYDHNSGTNPYRNERIARESGR